MKKLTLLLSILFCFLLVQAKKADLVLNLEVGNTYYTKSVTAGTINQEVMGQSIKIDMEVTAEMSFAVTGKSDEAFDLDVTYTSMVMDMKMPQANMTFSSKTPDAQDPLSGMLSKMTEQAFQLKLSNKGEVLEVKNLDVLMNSAIGAIGDLPEAQKQQLQKQLSDSYGMGAFKGNIGTMLSIFPDHKVKVGDSWNSSLNLESGMTLNVDMTYTYKGEEGGYYLIAGEGAMSTPENGSSIEANGMQMSFEMKGDMTSDLKIDKKTGWVMSGTTKQSFEGKISMAGNDQMPEGMEIPMSMTMTTIYTGN